jgi:NTE family protein
LSFACAALLALPILPPVKAWAVEKSSGASAGTPSRLAAGDSALSNASPAASFDSSTGAGGPSGESSAAKSGNGGRPKIGLALSGGGARGAAHIGVLRVLEEHRIPVDFIAGTSMGALVGGLYAAGRTPEQLETLISRIDWKDAFNDWIPRKDRSFRRKRDDDFYLVRHKPGLSGVRLKFPPGILDGQKIDLLLKKYSLPAVAVRDFDDLGIPYRAVATDLATGEAVVIGNGDLALAMRASMSLPAVFAPREIGGRLLVDGGISSNLPIDVVRRMGADVVIAVDISTPLSERRQLQSVLDVTEQITNILTRRGADLQIASLTDKDIFIRPDLGDITTASFERAAEAIPIGAAAAEAVLDELMPLSVSEKEYRAHMNDRGRGPASHAKPASSPVIDRVRIVNRSRLADGVITATLGINSGEPLDIVRLEKDLEQLYGLELFESVYYDITGEPGHTELEVSARERSWGPNYLQFGVAIFEDFEGPNFNLAAAYTRTAVNSLNGEWRTGFQVGQEPGVFTEFHQPLDRRLRKFIHAQASFIEEADNVYDSEGNKLSELGVRRYGAGLAVGRELGTWGEIRAGAVRETGEIGVQVGDPEQPDTRFETGEVFLQLFLDELDNVNFPRSGGDLRIRITAGLEELGSDQDYEQGYVDGSYAYTAGRLTGLLGGLFAVTRYSDAPYQRLYRLGGFTRLSGLEENELQGQHAALLSCIITRQVLNTNLLSLNGGLSFEYGNVFQERDDMEFENGIAAGSIFLGIDTLIGPIYLAYGRAEGGRGNFYFVLGQSFNHRRSRFRID